MVWHLEFVVVVSQSKFLSSVRDLHAPVRTCAFVQKSDSLTHGTEFSDSCSCRKASINKIKLGELILSIHLRAPGSSRSFIFLVLNPEKNW
jgi:hypothetical protein